MDKVSLVSLNARGLKNNLKRQSMFRYFKKEHFDIVCVQESHITSKDAHIWEKQWGGKIVFHEGTSHSKGQLILFSKRFMLNVEKIEIIHSQERLLVANIKHSDYEFTLANVYAPNDTNEKICFYKKIEDVLSPFLGHKLLVMGDFNSVMNNDTDIISGLPHSHHEINTLKTVVNNLELADLWRVQHESERDYSWCRYQPFIARRIDYCFASEAIVNLCISCKMISVLNTDHKAVTLEINKSNFVRGPGYWRFNNSLLEDKHFVNAMDVLLDKLLIENCNEMGKAMDYWEYCKVQIKEFCIEYCKEKACKRKNKVLELQNQFRTLESKLIIDPNNIALQAELHKIKHMSEIIALEKTKGAQVRARMRWIEEGEKNTRYFLQLEKDRGKQNIMNQVKNKDGIVVTNQFDVLEEQVQFYKTLYNQKTEVSNAEEAVDIFIRHEVLPVLTSEESKSCEGMISVEEASFALSSMKNGSSPGYDGLTVEYFKFFWGKIKHLVVNSFNASFNDGELSYTQKQGIIVLIHKGKDLPRNELKNWRPITLTNTDYKILAKTLAVRLSTVIQKLINQDQVGYLKGRHISSVIRTIEDVIEYLNFSNKSGFLLALDYYKAFDSISREFIVKTFDVFGFGENFKKWVKVLGNNTFSSINYGGWISKQFSVSCGIRQGCPFSPLSFILAVELLANKIRNSPISGILLPTQTEENSHLKVKQLADDTTLFLKNNEDMKEAARILNSFAKFSGLKLNTNKTKIMKIGVPLQERIVDFEEVNKIKILGIYFKNKEKCKNIKENWVNRVKRIENLIKTWGRRDLSIHGKIIIVKTFLISQLVFVMQSIGLPEEVLIQVNRLLYKFIWQRKFANKRAFEKIKRQVMEEEYKVGGLNMTNLLEMQNSFYLQWAGKLVHTNKENWSYIPIWNLNPLGSKLSCFEINCSLKQLASSTIKLIHSEFWRAVLLAVIKSKELVKREDVNENNFSQQLLFNNSLVQYKNKTLYFKDWIKNGIERIQDMVNKNEARLYSLKEIQEKTNLNPASLFFQYQAIINAIPNEWKNWVRIENVQCDNYLKDKIGIYNTKPKIIRKMIKSHKLRQATQPCACGFWYRKFGFRITEKDWLCARITTRETRLLELHWKIMQNIYPTNILLSKMKVVQHNKCSICVNEVDFVEHFFYECRPVKLFWEKIERLLYINLQEPISLDVLDILFGYQKPAENIRTINKYILIGKMTISIVKKTKVNSSLYIIFEQQLAIREKAKYV